MQAIEVRDDEIERRLDAYARARLSPDPQAIARVRSRIMREARLQFEAARIAAHIAPAMAVARHRSSVRRVAMPLLAASVWIGIAVGSISAGQAGGPLYSTRMWIEQATLPSSGIARTTAELERLEARLFEAAAAASRGDARAAQAALDAYGQIADEIVASANADPALALVVTNALDKHRAILAVVAASLAAKGNDTAAVALEAAIQRAITHSQAVIDTLGSAGGGGGSGAGGSDGPSSGGAGTGSSGGGVESGGTGTGSGSTGDGGSAGGNESGGEKPDRTPRPTPEVVPASPAPDRAPHGLGQ
ncbi:MAG TPA: hypothetical protein VGJ71_01325 [Candidatus Limnocylindrales bacterium]